MTANRPKKVLISGGREVGGLSSFSDALREGFVEIGIPAEIVRPSQILRRHSDLRDESVLKILSTSAMFAVPFSKRTICVAHGVGHVTAQGWSTLAGLLFCYKLANASSEARLVAVSHYVAEHLETLFRVRADAVVGNPLHPIYLEAPCTLPQERSYITYVGRLVSCKNVHRILRPLRDLLTDYSNLRVCIIGDGPQRAMLETLVSGDSRFEFKGNLPAAETRDYLRRSKVFISAHTTEGFGIAYVEALSQGCIVAMPASGGGLDIALDQIGCAVQLLPLGLDRDGVLATLRRALGVNPRQVDLSRYAPHSVALGYLEVDLQRRSTNGGRAAHVAEA